MVFLFNHFLDWSKPFLYYSAQMLDYFTLSNARRFYLSKDSIWVHMYMGRVNWVCLHIFPSRLAKTSPIILLCLMPARLHCIIFCIEFYNFIIIYNFTHQGKASGWESIKTCFQSSFKKDEC